MSDKGNGKENQFKMPDFNKMSTEEKLGFMVMRISSLENAFGIFIRYNKCEDKFKRYLKKELEAQREEYERRQKELEETEGKEGKSDKS